MKSWKQLAVVCAAGFMLSLCPASAQETAVREIRISAGEKEIVLINDTELELTQETEGSDLVFSEADGTRHCFKEVLSADWRDPHLTLDGSFLYITWKDETGKDAELTEEAGEKELAQPCEMKTLARMNLRAEPSGDGEVLTILEEGTVVTAMAELPGWYKVIVDGQTGYVVHTYVKAEGDEAASGEVYEVSRQAYDDCDGSGHGHYEITYSDGTVGYEKY